MKYNIQQLGLRPGDRIVVPKSQFRLVQHHALYLGQNLLGQDLIIENKIGIGVKVISAIAFFKEVVEITSIGRFKGTSLQRRRAVEKALARVGLPYDMINYNCQHFANEIQYGRVESDQVHKGIIGVAMVLVLGLLLID